jgi:peptide/nickel transport system substrate-binding protein
MPQKKKYDEEERKRMINHKWVKVFALLIASSLFLYACGPAATPQVTEKVVTQVVKETVKETVIVEGTPEEVEREVTRVIEVEKVITATPEPVAEKGGDLVYGYHDCGDSFDPAATFSSWVELTLSAVYDTLVYYGPDLEYYPGLAESWEVSDDGKDYTFHLRQDVTFHDGTPFTADAVKYTFDRIGVASTTVGKGAAGLMGEYDSTEIVDDYTVIIHFAEPFAAFLSSASHPFLSIVSPAAVQELGDEEFGRQPVGTGPFVFMEWVTGEHWTLEKNTDYNWAPAFFKHQGPPYLDSITFRCIEEAATRLVSLEKGEIDVMDRVPELEVERIRSTPGFQVISAETPMMPESILINVGKFPTDDLKVRQAMLHAVDKETMVNVLFQGLYPAAFGPLSPANPGYWGGVEGMYSYDLAKAQELLTAAGWEPGADGIRVDKDGNRLAMDLLYPGGEFRLRSYEFIQAQLREVGIDMEIQMLDSGAMFEKAVAGENNLSQLQWGFLDPAAMRNFWHSDNEGTGFNWSHVRSEEIDELLAQGESTPDWTERAAVYKTLQEKIMAEAYILPLYVITAFHGASDKVQDITVRPTARHVWLYDTYLEE